MAEQNYKNHTFYYWPHHFFFYGSVLAAFALCGFGIYTFPDQRWLWIMMTVIVFLVVWLAFMTRQHYALGNQDRTVRLELRLRYYILTANRLENIEAKLSFQQLSALRFASDEELPALIDIAIAEQLSPDHIKQRIKKMAARHYARVA